jgi:hypothetical protein
MESWRLFLANDRVSKASLRVIGELLDFVEALGIRLGFDCGEELLLIARK